MDNQHIKYTSHNILEHYKKLNARSKELYEYAKTLIPGGVNHDVRYLDPFPIYVTDAKGSKKTTADNHVLIDYWMGHGALILGHGNPMINKAVHNQMNKGTHFGACHELELRWAALVHSLIPSAGKVRFTASGNEATLLAIRIARAHTGRPGLIKFEGHFHGWHDDASAGYVSPESGITLETIKNNFLCPPNDIECVKEIIDNHEIAVVILEPAGGSGGTIPTDPRFLRELRKVTSKKGVILTFDEVITGFRYAPGGAQEYYNVVPDLTTLAKILCGGLPGGALAGRDDIMGNFTTGKVAHSGTFNANPLSAAAGISTLETLVDGKVHEQVSKKAHFLRREMNNIISSLGIDALAYGESSIIHLAIGQESIGLEKKPSLDYVTLLIVNKEIYQRFRCALLNEGIDTHPYHAWLSTVHSTKDLENTVKAFEKAIMYLSEDFGKIKCRLTKW